MATGTPVTRTTSQSRWQWALIAVLAAGLIYVGWQLQGGAVRVRDAGERLIGMQDQLRAAISEQQEVTQRLAQLVQQVDAAVQGVEETQSTLDTLQQGTNERLTALQSRLEPAIAAQQAAGRRLAQIEDQVFTAMTRQQAAAQRLTEFAGQVESVTQEMREARADLDAAREDIAALAAAPPAAAAAAAEPSKTWANTLDMAFALIPAGSFEMGSERGDADEQPVRSMALDKPFYIGQFEVTQAQWHAVMESDPSQFTGDPNRPVESVSWNDAQEFVTKLNVMEPDAHVSPAHRGRVGIRRARRRRLRPTPSATTRPNSTPTAGTPTTPATPLTRWARSQPNAWGLYAMHGGVWEWVQDRYGAYPSEAATESVGPPPGNRRVIRGGSWLASRRGLPRRLPQPRPPRLSRRQRRLPPRSHGPVT